MTEMKFKTLTDAALAVVFLITASCATLPKQVESPPGKYEIHQKDDRGVTTGVYVTTKFTETLVKSGTETTFVLNFIDLKGQPRSMKSYDIYKL